MCSSCVQKHAANAMRLASRACTSATRAHACSRRRSSTRPTPQSWRPLATWLCSIRRRAASSSTGWRCVPVGAVTSMRLAHATMSRLMACLLAAAVADLCCCRRCCACSLASWRRCWHSCRHRLAGSAGAPTSASSEWQATAGAASSRRCTWRAAPATWPLASSSTRLTTQSFRRRVPTIPALPRRSRRQRRCAPPASWALA